MAFAISKASTIPFSSIPFHSKITQNVGRYGDIIVNVVSMLNSQTLSREEAELLIGDFVVNPLRLKRFALPTLALLLLFSRSATCTEENTITTVELLRQTAEQARGAEFWTDDIRSSAEIEQQISWYVSALRCDYGRYSNSPLMDKKHWIRSLVDKGLTPSSKLYRAPLASSGVLTLRKRLVAFSSEEAVRKVENLYESNGIPTIEPKPPTMRIRDFYADPSRLPAEIKPSHVGDFGPRPRRNQIAE